MPKPRKKTKLTRAELRQQRSALERFETYLPLLQLREQLLQSAVLEVEKEYQALKETFDALDTKITTYSAVFKDISGVNADALSEPEDIKTVLTNIAGIKVPEFISAVFPKAEYSLFATASWVDQALSDQREKKLSGLQLEILETRLSTLRAELKKVVQRVNVFEKIIIPESKENIRRIRIALSDRMTAAVARAKIAKEKTQERKKS
ncbi:V-type ATP synthase subunit D [Desulfopila inferna]|uniref:V-type ATP synthase subunit D n=1 Tax=Desulfopila inferna TaxID=468528 RepID=UPI001964AAA3|nr:V-type ATP synthase subunit D [Desulfopila inferna]MBM9604172.1 V-type ATP synthase subunit D [Desulfopila inferna]